MNVLIDLDWTAVGQGIVLTATALWLVTRFIQSFLKICRPNEILIFSGRRRRLASGDVVGFKIVKSGATLRVPLLERVDRMDVTLLPITISLREVYSRGNIPLNLVAIANVKISTDDELVNNAVERFLGRDLQEVLEVARETLEGHLHSVVAQMTPEEINEKRLLFAEELEREAKPDLSKLGLQLDTLKIQHLSDEKNYLDSIGRRQISAALRETRWVESDCQRAAEEAESAARATGAARAGGLRSRAMALIEARDLTKTYPGLPRPALAGLDLVVDRGEVVGLLGPNGAGKTTAIRLIAGALAPTRGTVRILGTDPRASKAASHHMGIVAAEGGLQPRLTVRETLRFWSRLYGLGPRRFDERLAELGRALDLEELWERPCGTLSTGQRQRVRVARAALHDPAVLILDEVTAGLDVLATRAVFRSIATYRAQGRGILITTHIMSEAERLCDRIVLLHEGAAVFRGTPAALRRHTDCTTLEDAFLRVVAAQGS